MTEMGSDKKKMSAVIAVIIGLIVGVLTIAIWLLTYKQESYISTDIELGNHGTLECTSSSPVGPFFAFETQREAEHIIRVLFTGEKIKELSYRYDGKFNSDNAAVNAEAWMHADYNKYMSANGVNQELLNPVFMVNGDKLTISLYAEVKKLGSAVASLFFISSDKYKDIKDYSMSDYNEMYRSRGFTCQSHD